MLSRSPSPPLSSRSPSPTRSLSPAQLYQEPRKEYTPKNVQFENTSRPIQPPYFDAKTPLMIPNQAPYSIMQVVGATENIVVMWDTGNSSSPLISTKLAVYLGLPVQAAAAHTSIGAHGIAMTSNVAIPELILTDGNVRLRVRDVRVADTSSDCLNIDCNTMQEFGLAFDFLFQKVRLPNYTLPFYIFNPSILSAPDFLEAMDKHPEWHIGTLTWYANQLRWQRELARITEELAYASKEIDRVKTRIL